MNVTGTRQALWNSAARVACTHSLCAQHTKTSPRPCGSSCCYHSPRFPQCEPPPRCHQAQPVVQPKPSAAQRHRAGRVLATAGKAKTRSSNPGAGTTSTRIGKQTASHRSDRPTVSSSSCLASRTCRSMPVARTARATGPLMCLQELWRATKVQTPATNGSSDSFARRPLRHLHRRRPPARSREAFAQAARICQTAATVETAGSQHAAIATVTLTVTPPAAARSWAGATLPTPKATKLLSSRLRRHRRQRHRRHLRHRRRSPLRHRRRRSPLRHRRRRWPPTVRCW